MDYSTKSRDELVAICKEKNIKGYSGKKKDVLLQWLTSPSPQPVVSGNLTMIDLFAGTCAFTLAFQSTNAVSVVFGNDMVDHSKRIYDANFNHPLTLKT